MALLDHGLPLDYDLVESGNLTTESSYAACRRLLARKKAFSAIFCADDITAIGALQALREAGYSVPEDISLIGFDDIALVGHLNPALTTIRVNKEALGAMALKSLLIRTSDPLTPSVSYVLEVELVERHSVGPAH